MPVAIANLPADQLPSPTQSQPAPASVPIPGKPFAPQSLAAITSSAGPVVVLDPGHGGTDDGAHGASGIVEKDVTLLMAQAIRTQLQQNGFRVLLTRNGDQDPSFGDRAAIANGQEKAIFLSLHVSSAGPVGTVRTYVYPAEEELPEAPQDEIATSAKAQRIPASRGTQHELIAWDTAQQRFVADSRKLGDLLQVELSQRFPQSPELSTAFPIRTLRSVAAPAAAIEISSVSAPSLQTLVQMIPSLSDAVVRAIEAYQASNTGGKH